MGLNSEYEQLNTYKVSHRARKDGAIGSFSWFDAEIVAQDAATALQIHFDRLHAAGYETAGGRADQIGGRDLRRFKNDLEV